VYQKQRKQKSSNTFARNILIGWILKNAYPSRVSASYQSLSKRWPSRKGTLLNRLVYYCQRHIYGY